MENGKSLIKIPEQAGEHFDDNDFPLNSDDDDNDSLGSTDEGTYTNEEGGSSSDSSLNFPDPTSVYASEELTVASARLAVPALPKYKTIATIVPLSYLPGGSTSTKILLRLGPGDIEYVSLTRKNYDDEAIYPTAIILRMFSTFGNMVVSDSPSPVNVRVNKIIKEDDGKWWISNAIKLCPFIDNVIELLWTNSTIKEYLITLEIMKEMYESSNTVDDY